MGAVMPPGSGTVTLDTCKYCDGKKQKPGAPVIPWVDFDWPKDAKATITARMNRD
jgi:hypothetical protein